MLLLEPATTPAESRNSKDLKPPLKSGAKLGSPWLSQNPSAFLDFGSLLLLLPFSIFHLADTQEMLDMTGG